MSNSILNQAVTSGLAIQQDVGGSGLSGVVIGNSSNLLATVVMQGAGISRTLYPYTVDYFDTPVNTDGSPRTWSGNLQIHFSTSAVDTGAYVQIDTIGLGEPFNRRAYPIALSRGTLSTNVMTTNNTLSYETGNAGDLVADIGTASNNQNWVVHNDGSAVLKVEQSGTPHDAITLRGSGKPLLLGQGSDHVEVADTLDVDGNLFVVGSTNLDNGQISTDGSGNTTIGSTLTTLALLLNGVTIGGAANRFKVDLGGSNAIDLDSSHNLYFNNHAGSGYNLLIDDGGRVHFQTGSLIRLSTFTGTGTGTYSHGLGDTPDLVIVMTHAAGSQTVGYDSENSTTVHVTCGAGLAFKALALKF